MSRAGNVWENAAMESLFSYLKTVRTVRKRYWTRVEAKVDLFDYIQRFNNQKGRHSTMGQISMLAFKKQTD
jgi:putative transposase